MGIKISYQKLYLCCMVILISGCASGFNMEAISVMREFAKNQKEIDGYLKTQREGFLKLQQDILREKLYTGLAKQEITTKYGEPIYCSPNAENEQEQECLYRLPLEFFSTDNIGLYFDKDNRLIRWILKPAGN